MTLKGNDLMHISFPPFRTSRLTIRPLNDDDLEGVFSVLGCPKTTAGRSFKKETREEAQVWLATRLFQEATSGFSIRAIEDHAGQMIGLCGLCPRNSMAELCYVVKFEFQRKGFGREAVSAIADQAKALGLEVFAAIRSTNIASKKSR